MPHQDAANCTRCEPILPYFTAEAGSLLPKILRITPLLCFGGFVLPLRCDSPPPLIDARSLPPAGLVGAVFWFLGWVDYKLKGSPRQMHGRCHWRLHGHCCLSKNVVLRRQHGLHILFYDLSCWAGAYALPRRLAHPIYSSKTLVVLFHDSRLGTCL